MIEFLRTGMDLLRSQRRSWRTRLILPAVIASGLLVGALTTGTMILLNSVLRRGEPIAVEVWAFASLCLAVPVLRFANSASTAHLGQAFQSDLRVQLARRIAATPLARLEQIGSHRLVSALIGDVNTVSSGLANVPVLAVNVAIIAGCLTYLGYLSMLVLALLVVGFGLGTAVYRLAIRAGGRHLHHSRLAYDQVCKHIQALCSGIKELQLNDRRRQSFFAELFERDAESCRAHGLRGDLFYVAGSAWGQSFFFLLVGLLVFDLPAFGDSERGALVAYTLVLLYMASPIAVALALLPSFSQGVVAVQRIQALQTQLEPGVQGAEAASAPQGWQHLELRGITHLYGDDRASSFQLGPIDLELTPGEIVFVVGGNGSGKSTLAKVLVGLYRPDSGEIRLDGKKIEAADQGRYRQLFSAVFQDFHVFQELLGLDPAHAAAHGPELLRKLQLEGKVAIEDKQLSTLDVSFGQRKRLALLVALLEDRPIYLFDEWSADQDPSFRELFYRELLPALKAGGKTAVVISHDDRYFGCADRIVKLDFGRIDPRVPEVAPAALVES